MKLDSNESIQWTTVIDNHQERISRSLAFSQNRVIRTQDNGYVIAGILFNISGTDEDLRILRLSSGGNRVWERRVPGQHGQVLSLVQRDDGGYIVFTREGRIYGFDTTGTPESIQLIPEEGISPVVTTISGEDGTRQYTEIYNPLEVLRFSRNGTVLSRTIPDPSLYEGTTGIIAVRDGGFLQAQLISNDHPGGGQKIRIERTNASGTVVWGTTLGVCRFTFCNNDLLGMHETENGEFGIVYQSREQSNASAGNPAVTMYTLVERDGRVLQEVPVTNVAGLPVWVFKQNVSSPEFTDLVPADLRNSLKQETHPGNPTLLDVSLLKTPDGGYALLGTRCYWE